MSLDDLKPNGLYVVLFIRSYEYDPDNFHWSLYHHQSTKTGGMKYHVTGLEGRWLADHKPSGGVFKSFLLVGLFHVANIPSGMEDRARDLITQDDNRLNDIEGNTCRVWLMTALARLNAAGIMQCSSMDALETEILTWGNSHYRSAIVAETPRPLGASNLCGQL